MSLYGFGKKRQQVLEQELEVLVKKTRAELSGFCLAAERWLM